jgi:hypothetical protein
MVTASMDCVILLVANVAMQHLNIVMNVMKQMVRHVTQTLNANRETVML